MTLFDYINTGLWALLGLSNMRTRAMVRKEFSRLRMHVMAAALHKEAKS